MLQTTPSPTNRGCCRPLSAHLPGPLHLDDIYKCTYDQTASFVIASFETEPEIMILWVKLTPHRGECAGKTLSYRFPLLSPLWHLQSATGNKGNSAHCIHPEAPLWHSDRTSYLPPSTSASQVWPWRWFQVAKGWSPCTYPPVGGGGTEEALSVETPVNSWSSRTHRSSAKVQSRVVQQGALALSMFPQQGHKDVIVGAGILWCTSRYSNRVGFHLKTFSETFWKYQ